jgi:hypothetical protein
MFELRVELRQQFVLLELCQLIGAFVWLRGALLWCSGG